MLLAPPSGFGSRALTLSLGTTHQGSDDSGSDSDSGPEEFV